MYLSKPDGAQHKRGIWVRSGGVEIRCNHSYDNTYSIWVKRCVSRINFIVSFIIIWFTLNDRVSWP